MGWGDLRRRLDPVDRRCWAYLHPVMPADPLIFVEVALTRGLADSVQAILSPARQDAPPDSATFYSISACQPGLRGIGLGDPLLRDAAAALAGEGVRQVGTLSPMPGFRRWRAAQDGADGLPRPAEIDAPLEALPAPSNPLRQAAAAALRRAGARYLLDGEGARPPLDPVARFHLGNGAEAWRLNPFADLSPNGRRQSFGLMANYRYDPARLRARQEAHHGRQARAASDGVRADAAGS
jgi:malonyl-CoA decarboxylase